ncbi:5-oxoprolinase subunit PxpB [Pseudoalteromonas sp. BZB3]|uniref:5-oxoprolinase subunit PxpB n=1 Tax=Pseudoalteromonas sp. BZB3 TaxID=3136670 RepID=UPI0032C4A775|tara:strand:- start:61 stop:708 length:648 start_codon:yes stop_codon:yes gene_type:complete
MTCVQCYQLSEQALVLSIDGLITQEVRQKIFALAQTANNTNDFFDIVPANSSITFYLNDFTRADYWLEQLITLWEKCEPEAFTPKTHLIDTFYGGEYGPDLNEVSELTGLNQKQVVELHASKEYLVGFLGFLPGFGYLESLPEQLRLPRKATPRAHVPSLSVAIAESLTAIYPSSSPGGWHLIGRCEQPLFDPHADSPSLLAPGDVVRFIPKEHR